MVEESNNDRPLITISEIKQIFEVENNSSALDKLKKKIDGLVSEGSWDFSEVFEHDYSLSPIRECLIYYLVGYLTKQITKNTKCNICISAFNSMQTYSNLPEAELTNIKSKGKLIHPNYVFYKFIYNVEEYFTKNINDPEVYTKTVEDVLDNETLNFPCLTHKDDILAYSIRYYLNMRMRQFTRQVNREKLKENSKKKKISKFCSTWYFIDIYLNFLIKIVYLSINVFSTFIISHMFSMMYSFNAIILETWRYLYVPTYFFAYKIKMLFIERIR